MQWLATGTTGRLATSFAARISSSDIYIKLELYCLSQDYHSLHHHRADERRVRRELGRDLDTHSCIVAGDQYLDEKAIDQWTGSSLASTLQSRAISPRISDAITTSRIWVAIGELMASARRAGIAIARPANRLQADPLSG